MPGFRGSPWGRVGTAPREHWHCQRHLAATLRVLWASERGEVGCCWAPHNACDGHPQSEVAQMSTVLGWEPGFSFCILTPLTNDTPLSSLEGLSLLSAD